MSAAQQQHTPEEQEEVGWQDTDSEGVVNDWQVADMDEDEDEDNEEQQQPPAATPQQQQQLYEGTADVALLQHTQELQQQQQQQQQQQLVGNLEQQPDATADVEQPQDHPHQDQNLQPLEWNAEAEAAFPRRPLHGHIAALIHRRVQALLRQALHQPNTTEDAAALQALLQHTTEVGAADHGIGSLSSEGSSGSEDFMDEGAEDPPEGCTTTRFDPNITASHQYLGDVDELEGTYGLLPEGTTARLPLLLLDGVVLFPGCQLPLLLSSSTEQHMLDRALAAPPPLTRLLAVLPGARSWMHGFPRLVACTAEVRQMRRQSEDPGQQVAVLALGRQRAEVVVEQQLHARSQSSVLVRILPEGCQSDVPQPMRSYASAIHPVLTAPWDLTLLVGRVRRLIQLVLMPVASFQGTPLELSYWVSHNLPLQPSTRQLLLTASGPAERLRLLLGLLERLDQLGCSECGAALATTAEVLAMTSEGISGTFVNSHGYVHEMVTFRRVQGVHLGGRPETAHSWFPGYAWTIAYCSACGQHLGWRFTAVEQGLAPRVFWGLRRQVLTCSTRPSARGEQGAGGLGAGGLGAGGAVVIQLGNLPVAAAGEGEEGEAAG